VEHPEQRERPAQVGQKPFHVLGRLAPHLSSPCSESARWRHNRRSGL
jgi:hypothetical protein